MAVNTEDIETLWQRYSDEGENKGISVAQFFESNTFLITIPIKLPNPQTSEPCSPKHFKKGEMSEEMLGLRLMAKKGKDAYKRHKKSANICYSQNKVLSLHTEYG